MMIAGRTGVPRWRIRLPMRAVRKVAGVALILAGLSRGCPVLAQTEAMFRPADATPETVPAPAEGSLRTRLVSVDLNELGLASNLVRSRMAEQTAVPRQTQSDVVPAIAPTLHLNLFDDLSVTAIVEWTEPTFSGGYSLSGRLVGDRLGSMTLVVNEDRLVGSVETGGRTYEIRSAGAGLTSISEVEVPPLRCGVDGLTPGPDHTH